MKKFFYFILLTLSISIYGMQFDKFNERVYFDRSNQEDKMRTDNIKLNINIEKAYADIIVFEFVDFQKIKQENIHFNKENSLMLKLKNYDVYFLKSDIQEILDEKNSKEKIPDKISNYKYKKWRQQYRATEIAITKLFNQGRFKAYTKNSKEISDFQKGDFGMIYCYYKKLNVCNQGMYHSIADQNNEIIWYDEYRFYNHSIPKREVIKKYLKDEYQIEIE